MWSDLGSVVPPPPPGAPGLGSLPPESVPFAGVPEDHLEPPDPVGPPGTVAATPRVELPPMPAGPRVVYHAGSDADLAALPSSVLVEPARPWTVIVLHHSATARGSVAVFDPMHRARGWEGVGYDFVVGNGTDTGDGELEVTFRWREQKDGAHAKGWNDVAIGICLVGNYEDAPPTPRQQETLVRLLRHLRRRFGIPPERIVGHRTLNPTLCPGRFFPLEALLRTSAP